MKKEAFVSVLCGAFLALVVAGFYLVPEPKPPVEPEPPQPRWAPESIADDVDLLSSDYPINYRDGPYSCPEWGSFLGRAIANANDYAPMEVGEYESSGVTVRYRVLWTDLEGWPRGPFATYEDFDPPAKTLDQRLADCVVDVSGERGFGGFPVLEGWGWSWEEPGWWYESTVKPEGWVRPAVPEGYRKAAEEYPLAEPFQSAGLYTWVDGWLIVTVQAEVEDETTDLASAVDLRALLDDVVAKVEADPLTKEDYWEYRKRFEG